jgi:hypothetical protein
MVENSRGPQQSSQSQTRVKARSIWISPIGFTIGNQASQGAIGPLPVPLFCGRLSTRRESFFDSQALFAALAFGDAG